MGPINPCIKDKKNYVAGFPGVDSLHIAWFWYTLIDSLFAASNLLPI